MILWKEPGSRVGRFSCVEAREGVGAEGSPFSPCAQKRGWEREGDPGGVVMGSPTFPL